MAIFKLHFFQDMKIRIVLGGKTKSVFGVTIFLDHGTETSRTARDASAVFFMYLRNHNWTI